MKTTLGQRIKARRKDLGLSQGKLGELAGLDQTVISKLERGDVQETSRIAELASVLRCDALWLATGKAESGNVSNVAHSAANRVPLISFVAAGNWGDAVDNYAPGDAEAWVETTVPVKRHTYALRVEGDSMEPRFPNGAILIVEPEAEAKNGSYVIVRQNGTDATFKQLVHDGGRWYLKPVNPRYPIMELAEDAVLCGVVKQMVMDVE
ncbi:MAG TPA: S24 family peptidase [Gallionellaceae bacterium]|nr:S24 family peptidase [Gallionellaceae bacterium]